MGKLYLTLVTTDVKFTKHLTMNGKLFVGKIHVQNRNIVGDSVRKLAYNIPEINFSTFQLTIVSRSYDKRKIILR